MTFDKDKLDAKWGDPLRTDGVKRFALAANTLRSIGRGSDASLIGYQLMGWERSHFEQAAALIDDVVRMLQGDDLKGRP